MALKVKVRDIAFFLGGEVVGDSGVDISGIKGIKEAGSGDLAFLLDARLSGLLDNTKASCIIVPSTIEKAGLTLIKVKSPQLAFAKIVNFLNIAPIPHPKKIDEKAVISKEAKIGRNVGIGAYVVIEAGAEIGDGVKIYPFSYIGHNTKIGPESIIYSNVSIRERVTIGARVIIHPGTVIGSDGFGYDNSTGVHVKIPQIGDVIIEDDVEIGANVTVDRAKFAHTRIRKGTKIDNLVQVAHNVEIGEHSIIVAQCGISGSSSIGSGVIMGGQVGVTDHVKIGDGAMVGAQSGVTKNVPPKTIVIGAPAKPVKEAKDIIVLQGRLPELYQRIRNLEKIVGVKKECKEQSQNPQ